MSEKIHFKFLWLSANAEGAGAIKSLERLVSYGIVALVLITIGIGSGIFGKAIRIIISVFGV